MKTSSMVRVVTRVRVRVPLGLLFHEGVVYGTGGDMVPVHIIREHDDLVRGRGRGRVRGRIGVGVRVGLG